MIRAALKCPKCQSDLQIEIGDPQIVNLPRTSIVVVEHPTIVTCIGCGTPVMVAIQAIQQLILNTLPAPASAVGLIATPGGLLPS